MTRKGAIESVYRAAHAVPAVDDRRSRSWARLNYRSRGEDSRHHAGT